MKYITKQVASNKSSSFAKDTKVKHQTLQLLTKIIKTESIKKLIKMQR
jgi:hypothetical protein